MEILISVLAALRSPKISAIIVLFCVIVLFAPYDILKISRPEFVDNYQAVITTILFLSLSVLIIEISVRSWRLLTLPFVSRRKARLRTTRVKDIFYSLNLDELCVVYAMTQSGITVIKADYSNIVMLSLRQKGALSLAVGSYSSVQFPHVMPKDLFDLVQSEGLDRFPEEFRKSTRFYDEVRERVDQATNWRSW